MPIFCLLYILNVKTAIGYLECCKPFFKPLKPFHTKAAVLWSDGDLFLGLPLSYSIIIIMCFVSKSPTSAQSAKELITVLLSIHILSIIIVHLVCFLLLYSSVSSEPKRKRKRSSECSETLTTNGISSLRLGSLKSEPGTWKQLAVNFLF